MSAASMATESCCSSTLLAPVGAAAEASSGEGSRLESVSVPAPPLPLEAPPCPSLTLTQLRLAKWFRPSAAGTKLIAAVHVNVDPQMPGATSVVYWSRPVEVVTVGGDGAAAADVVFELNVSVHADVRVSVFNVKKLEAARKEQRKRTGHDRLHFDCRSTRSADTNDASEASATKTGGASGGVVAAAPATRARRVVAGREPGCAFFFLFHTNFVEGGVLQVPLDEMDKAFKNKRGQYRPEGLATLQYICTTV
jgi:hypothetical protein